MSKNSRRRRKKLQKARDAHQTKSMAIHPENMNESSYGRTEAYLRTSCADNSFMIPEEFEYWQIYFWSNGSRLREWAKWLGEKLVGRNPKIDTDMTPNKELERKIKERRLQSGKPGPTFTTVQTQTPRAPSNQRTQWTPKRKEPALPAPSGTEGSAHHIL